MSKENGNLRLLGSPVNLLYRGKKKDDKKSVKNRPRSALQNSCFTPETEKYKRPFSADAKERVQSTRSLLNSFNIESLETYETQNNFIRVVPPTTDILGTPKTPNYKYINKEVCSNASDYGSEDTFISLGTKIKNKAQLTPKNKPSNVKNFLKYRNIIKKGRKLMENPMNEDKHCYDFNVKIIERNNRSSSPLRQNESLQVCSLPPTCRSPLPPKTSSYDSYFIPLNSEKNTGDIAGRVSFGSSNIQADVDETIDTYSHHLTTTKHQLSLVEEESTQDLESGPSQHLSSLSPENSIEDVKNKDDELMNAETYLVDEKDCPKRTNNLISEVRTYTSFYDDFNNANAYRTKMSSSINTDSASKDSGYHDSGANDNKAYKFDFSLPSSYAKRSNSLNKIEDQPKSLDSASTSSNDKSYHNTFPFDKKAQWAEPLNHSRLLYKDFFLKKEGHIAVPPQNSPKKSMMQEIQQSSEVTEIGSDYPSYLLNSSTKAYTSKVIEDYKKELEAINNLHELTLKDIQTDSISPTPLNIDEIFVLNSENSSDKNADVPAIPQQKVVNTHTTTNKNIKTDIDKISTKELIQNYLKVKDGDFTKGNIPAILKKFERKVSNDCYGEQITSMNNKTKGKSNLPLNLRGQTQKNIFTMKAPLSARIDSVQTDKDVDSWMSMSAPSPRVIDVDREDEPKETQSPKVDENSVDSSKAIPEIKELVQEIDSNITSNADNFKSKELSSNSTVMDIYSMLKEIESFGENPVTAVTTLPDDKIEENKDKTKEERLPTPKDNFMEIFEFLEKVEQSANDALSVVTSTTPASIPNLESLLKLPQTELAQRLVTASLQLEERSCCIALLQESLTNHKEQMINKVSNLEKQSQRNISKVKQECEEAIKRHQSFIDQLINDKKTLNHRIEQLVDERRALEERWRRATVALEERHKLELRNQHDKMAAAQQVARQRWVRQKAEKIKELTVKGLEGELRDMADRQQKEISDLKMSHAEQTGRAHARHAAELDELRATMQREKEEALLKERQLASSRLEKQILELEVSVQQQRTRLVSELRADNERAAAALAEREKQLKEEIENWKKDQEQIIEEKRAAMEEVIAKQRENIEEQMNQKRVELEEKFEQYKKDFEAEQQVLLKKKVAEISAQHKLERDREIEKAIESMEAEAQAGRKELQEAIRRNKEQYECELKELGATEQATLRRYQDAQARARRAEDTCAELEVTIGQLEVRNKVLIEKNTQLEAQAAEVKASCEENWKNKMEIMNKEMDDLKKTHEAQMHQLYAKVKVAVARKDSAIQALTRETAKYQEKITMLEQKLQLQRKDFLKQK